MLQLTRVYMGNSMFRGNASLNGQLSHLLDEDNVTQVLPLEPPDAWARRQEEVITYLRNFRQLVKLFNMERPTKCEWYPGQGGSPRKGRLFHAAGAWGWLSGTDRRRDGDTRAKPLCGQREPFCGAENFLPGAHPGNGIMLNLLLLLRKRAGGCSLGW